MQPLTEQEAINFFSIFYGGEHHIPGCKVNRGGSSYSVNDTRGDMATFDFNKLTKLVVMAHDMCIRVSVEAVRNGIIKIAIWKRDPSGVKIFDRHPKLEDHITDIRKTLNSFQ